MDGQEKLLEALPSFPLGTIGDRYADLISVPGGSSLQTFVLFPTRLHSSKHKKA